MICADEEDGGRGGGVAVVLSQREPVKKELATGATVEGGPGSNKAAIFAAAPRHKLWVGDRVERLQREKCTSLWL